MQWSIVANLVRNGYRTDELTNVRENFGAMPILHCHTHYFSSVRDHAQKPPTMPTKSRDIRTKIG